MIRIGVVEQGYGKTDHYTACVAAAGNGAVTWEVLPWAAPKRAREDAARFDALVVCGGDDVAARHFGQEDHPEATLDFEERDLYELALCRAAVDLAVPLLGVCRGMQVLNVALGGDLDQHLPAVPGRGEHADGVLHGLRVQAGSLLARVLDGAAEVRVNSHHHQAVRTVADGLRATAWAPDGAVEAVEAVGAVEGVARFCLGVQWHPEKVGNIEPLGVGLFRALVDAARGQPVGPAS